MNNKDFDISTISNTIDPLNLKEIPSSSFNIIMGSRRSGKSYLTEYIVKKMIDEGQVDCCFLFSKTDASFDFIKHECRFKEIDELNRIVDNYKVMNSYNKLQTKKKKQFNIKTVIIIDDMVVEMKTKKYNILESLATLGRHYAYDPLSLHFFILSQSLTKVPRVVRLNCDHIFMNNIASSLERDMILQENFYRVASGRKNTQIGRDLYYSLVSKEDFTFLVVENHRQNIKEYKDYIKTIKAD
jgi:hypothetical protein